MQKVKANFRKQITQSKPQIKLNNCKKKHVIQIKLLAENFKKRIADTFTVQWLQDNDSTARQFRL